MSNGDIDNHDDLPVIIVQAAPVRNETVESQLPKPNAGFLLVWLASSLLVLAATPGDAPDAIVKSGHESFYQTARLLASLFFGTCVGSFVIAIWQWNQGRKFPVQPGEWLLTAIGIGVLLSMCMRLLFQFEILDEKTTALMVHIGYFVPFFAVLIGADKSLGWGLLMVTALINIFLLIVVDLGNLASLDSTRFLKVLEPYLKNWNIFVLGSAIFGVFLVGYSAIYDLLHPIRQSWLHWVGTSVVTVLLILIIAGRLAQIHF